MTLARERRALIERVIVVLDLLSDGVECELLGVTILKEATNREVLNALHNIAKVQAGALLVYKRASNVETLVDFELILSLFEWVVEINGERIIKEVRCRRRNERKSRQLYIVAAVLSLVPSSVN